ncbi:MAG: hypothetical protein CVU65_13945 [Deltaproteobacteria bacterium HGW-Deltaproteobacteria-22]|nr:MAG: hypothetical protein CVU65_13945 [Deltaproteobacteria bacterium HGW-Deltaproteobacteria-22]
MFNQVCISLIVVFGIAFSGGCASGTFRVDSAQKRAVTVSELISGHEKYAAQLARRQEVIISVKKGEEIPMDLTLDTGIVSFRNRERLVVVRDLCVLISRKTVALSPDCRTFAPMGNGRALRRLFRMGKGSVSAGLSLDEQGVHMPVLIRQK